MLCLIREKLELIIDERRVFDIVRLEKGLIFMSLNFELITLIRGKISILFTSK